MSSCGPTEGKRAKEKFHGSQCKPRAHIEKGCCRRVNVYVRQHPKTTRNTCRICKLDILGSMIAMLAEAST
jgi:hypothetical protein